MRLEDLVFLSEQEGTSKKYRAEVDGEKTEVTFKDWKDNDDDEINVQISWGSESHNLDFRYDDIGDDHDTEGADAMFIAKSEDGKWNFEMSVAVAYGYKSGQCNPCIQDYPVEITRDVYLNVIKDPEWAKKVDDFNKDDMEEGTCGYSKDGKPRNKPAGPDMLQERFKKLAGLIK
jgi:hypothetical protein